MGIHICNIRDARTLRTSSKANVHQKIGQYQNGTAIYFDDICNGIYDYVLDDGYNHMGQ